MNDNVTSVLSVSSKRLNVDLLSHYLPWKIVEATKPNEKVDYFVTVFDLGIGHDDRVDRHLERATEELFKKLIDLEQLLDECKYTLWLRYRFSSIDGGAANIAPVISSRLAHLRIELILHLNEF